MSKVRGRGRPVFTVLVRTLFRTIVISAFTLLERLLPASPGRIVFGSDSGKSYSGTTRTLFEQMAADKSWDPIWVSSSAAVIQQINKLFPGRAVSWYSPVGVLKAMRAEAFFVTHGNTDLGTLALSRRRNVIYTNHGIPLKSMGFSRKTLKPLGFGLAQHTDAVVRRQARRYEAALASSELEAKLWSAAYDIPLDRIWVTGTPRTDCLVRSPAPRPVHPAFAAKKVVLYAPTYRDWKVLTDFRPVPGLADQDLLAVLSESSAALLIRSHYFEADAARRTISELGTPPVFDGGIAAFSEINDILPHIDLLITDYSSIYLDFLLVDKPIIFTPYDLDEYVENRGILFSYEDHTPGYKCRTPAEFVEALRTELTGADPHRLERARMRDLFHKYQDGMSAQRVAQRLSSFVGSDRLPRANP